MVLGFGWHSRRRLRGRSDWQVFIFGPHLPPELRSFSSRSFLASMALCVALCVFSAVSRAAMAVFTEERTRTYSFIGSSKTAVSRSASSVYVAERRPTHRPIEEIPAARDSLMLRSHSASCA